MLKFILYWHVEIHPPFSALKFSAKKCAYTVHTWRHIFSLLVQPGRDTSAKNPWQHTLSFHWTTSHPLLAQVQLMLELSCIFTLFQICNASGLPRQQHCGICHGHSSESRSWLYILHFFLLQSSPSTLNPQPSTLNSSTLQFCNEHKP